MGNLYKFAVIGSRSFNNYYLLREYLKSYLPDNAVIITGHAAGADQLAEVYAQSHGHPLEIYESNWEIFGKDAISRQRKDIVNNSNFCIAFWDGKSSGTGSLIRMFEQAGKTVTVIDVTDKDIIKQDPMVGHVNHDVFDVYIGRGKGSELGNPFKIDAKNSRTVVLAQYTEHLLSTPQLLAKVLELDGKRLGCWCHQEHLCHGDVIYWLLRNVKPQLECIVAAWKNPGIVFEKERPSDKKKESFEDLLGRWSEMSPEGELCTHEGTVFAAGFNRTVTDRYMRVFLEIDHNHINRAMIHRWKDDIDNGTDDQDKVDLKYKVNDKSGTTLKYRQKEFSNDDFKSGYWYVDARDVERRVK